MAHLLQINKQYNNLISATTEWRFRHPDSLIPAWGEEKKEKPEIDYGILSLEMYIEPGMNTDDILSFLPRKAFLKCKHCGQYGALYTPCAHCGAPID